LTELHDTIAALESKTSDNFRKAEIDREGLHSSVRAVSIKAEKCMAIVKEFEI